MEPKEAARSSKQYISEIFREDGAEDIGLEEIRFDPQTKTWRVTVGFYRPWYDPDTLPVHASISEIMGPRKKSREMKVVTLADSDGHVLSVTNRE